MINEVGSWQLAVWQLAGGEEEHEMEDINLDAIDATQTTMSVLPRFPPFPRVNTLRLLYFLFSIFWVGLLCGLLLFGVRLFRLVSFASSRSPRLIFSERLSDPSNTTDQFRILAFSPAATEPTRS